MVKIERNINMDYIDLSKEISYALRHAPREYELEMDEAEFVSLAQLFCAINEEERYQKSL